MTPPRFDVVFLNTRRETVVLLCVFAVFLIWSVGVSYWLGYGTDPSLAADHLVFGIPRWVFWGVCVPWMAANVFTIWFACCFVADDPLEATSRLEDEESEVAP